MSHYSDSDSVNSFDNSCDNSDNDCILQSECFIQFVENIQQDSISNSEKYITETPQPADVDLNVIFEPIHLENNLHYNQEPEQKPQIVQELEQKPQIVQELEQEPQIVKELEQTPQIVKEPQIVQELEQIIQKNESQTKINIVKPELVKNNFLQKCVIS